MPHYDPYPGFIRGAHLALKELGDGYITIGEERRGGVK